MYMEFQHQPVLLASTIDYLAPNPGCPKNKVFKSLPGSTETGVYVDGTFGRGGHSRALLDRLGPKARLVVFDKDPQAITEAKALSSVDHRVKVVHRGFSKIREELASLGIERINGLMLDLGVSSPQIDDPKRGFSFVREGPLDMRMDTTHSLTAQKWLQKASFEDIKEVIEVYGEERFARQIARAIVLKRQDRPINTTKELSEIVRKATRYQRGVKHPATRTFQALRIYLNQELIELTRVLAASLELLLPGGRLVVTSFHSLEDRIVKKCIMKASKPATTYAHLPILEKDMPSPILRALTRLKATGNELALNSRARSAILRAAEKTEAKIEIGDGIRFVETDHLPSIEGTSLSHLWKK